MQKNGHCLLSEESEEEADQSRYQKASGSAVAE